MRLTSVRLKQSLPFAAIPEWLQSKRAANLNGYDSKIVHVTSEKLCDDTLNVLKSTLPRPHTCDIIELNPGPCVWSRKIHDVLKPRRHVLIEPQHRLFTECIDPLLQLPDSPYRLARTVNEALDSSARLLSEDIYDFQERPDTSNGPRYRINDNLLLLANLSGKARTATGFHGSIAKQFLNHFYRSIFVRENFMHRYGLIRLLAWVNEDSRKTIIPTTVNLRTKQSIQLESTCLVQEIAGPSQQQHRHPHQLRWYDIDIENQYLVRKQQKYLGLNTGPDRAQPEPAPPFVSLKPVIEEVRKNKNSYPHNQIYIQKVLKIDKYLAAHEPEWYAQYQRDLENGSVKRGLWRGKRSTPTQREYLNYTIQLRSRHNTYLKSKDFIWEQRQLYKKIRNGFSQGWFSTETGLPQEGEHKTDAIGLLQKDELLEKQSQRIKTDTQTFVRKAGDDYRCFDSQIMAWNRRRFEPLFVQDSEFVPHSPLALIDFQPDPNVPTRLDTIDKQTCFDYVCTNMMTQPSDSIANSLSRLIPTDLERFMKKVPELRDPTKGGWWNLEHVRVRAMHHELFIAIALAYHDWPFRPPINKLLASESGFLANKMLV